MKRDERPEDRPPTPEAIVTQAHDVVWPDSYRVPADLLGELVQFVRRFVPQRGGLPTWRLRARKPKAERLACSKFWKGLLRNRG